MRVFESCRAARLRCCCGGGGVDVERVPRVRARARRHTAVAAVLDNRRFEGLRGEGGAGTNGGLMSGD